MHKTHLSKQARDQLEIIKSILSQNPAGQFHTKDEVEELLKALREAEKSLLVLQYVLNQQELSGDWNVHLKIMENQNKQEENAEARNSNQQEPLIQQSPGTAPPPTEQDKTFIPPTTSTPTPTTANKKVELSINDRFRITNELFKQNKQEFEIALEQLNIIESWNDARIYLSGLAGLYQWDEEKELVKLFHRLVQRRFS